jgi:lipoate-protein ligase A
MYQSVREDDLTPDEHLEQEWHLFQQIEAGGAVYLCRTWETTEPVVIVGRSTRADEQVIQKACHEDGVRVLRRFTGGGAVVLGPGCLNYAIGLSLVARPDLMDVAGSFAAILGQIVMELGTEGLSIDGGTDLVLKGRKVSGNAQRRGRRALLHHGTLLYAFDARLAARYLREPDRKPAYRASRRHTEFIGNLPLSRDSLRTHLETVCSGLGVGGGVVGQCLRQRQTYA